MGCDVTSGWLRVNIVQPSILITAARGQHFTRQLLPPLLILDFMETDSNQTQIQVQIQVQIQLVPHVGAGILEVQSADRKSFSLPRFLSPVLVFSPVWW